MKSVEMGSFVFAAVDGAIVWLDFDKSSKNVSLSINDTVLVLADSCADTNYVKVLTRLGVGEMSTWSLKNNDFDVES